MKTQLHGRTSPLGLAVLVQLAWLASTASHAAALDERVWTNQQGKTVTASLVLVNGDNALLELANGVRYSVLLSTLSSTDQSYARQWSQNHGPAKASPPATLTWPAPIFVNAKDMQVTPGEQNVQARQYGYDAGAFHFVSNAPLAGTVMKEIAADFELIRQVAIAMPWGLQPSPQNGNRFRVFLTETDQDYIALGGNDSSGAGSKDDYAFIKFSVLGLKKVGPRYAYDAREKSPGELAGVTLRLMMGDMRQAVFPWSMQGIEELLRTVAYHKGGFHFDNLTGEMKARIQEQAKIGVHPDLDRMMEYLHMPRTEQRSDVKMIRRQNYFDGMLLVYYFGFLADDGKGTALHRYYRKLAESARGPRLPATEATQRAEALLAELLAGRTDDQLKADMTARFKAALNLKLGR